MDPVWTLLVLQPALYSCLLACLHHLQILRGTYAPLPEQYSPELHALVAALLRRKPEQRPSIDEASLCEGGMDGRIRAMQLRASLPVNCSAWLANHVVRTVASCCRYWPCPTCGCT